MMETRDKQKQRETAEALRRAITAAIDAGNRPSEVRGIVSDQLFGIAHFGLTEIKRLEAAGESEATE